MTEVLCKIILSITILISLISCKEDTRCMGIDISHHNHLTKKDWKTLKKQNIKFVFIKASEGKSYKDPMRFVHFNNAMEVTTNIFGYHFFRDDCSAKEQFKNYKEACEAFTTVGLRPCIDYEKQGFTKNEKERIAILKELNELIYKDCTDYPIIYCNILEYFKIKTLFPNNPFWIDASSPDLGLGVIKQEIKKLNGKDIDYDYCNDIHNIDWFD